MTCVDRPDLRDNHFYSSIGIHKFPRVTAGVETVHVKPFSPTAGVDTDHAKPIFPMLVLKQIMLNIFVIQLMSFELTSRLFFILASKKRGKNGTRKNMLKIAIEPNFTPIWLCLQISEK